MKYYAHNIRDFNNATRHLTRLERSIYRDLIELYYDEEKQLSLDVKAVCRKVLAHTEEEVTAVEQTLNEFFTQTPTGWYHEVCEEEIDSYRANNSQKSVAGKASAAARAAKKQRALNGNSTDVEQTLNGSSTDIEQTSNAASTNRKPLTVNQEPNITPASQANAHASEAQKFGGIDHRKPIDDWQPNNETIEALVGLDHIPREFVDSQIPEFRLYWTDRNEPATSWNSKFLKNCRSEWRKNGHIWRAAHDGELITDDFYPDEAFWDWVRTQGFDNLSVACDLLPKFIIETRDAGIRDVTWNSRFTDYVSRHARKSA